MVFLDFIRENSIPLKPQGWIQDFFKEGVVILRIHGKRPRAKGMGEGAVFEYVEFLHFHFRGILSTIRDGNRTEWSTIQFSE